MDISRQEIEYARQLAALRRAKRGIGLTCDTKKSFYAKDGGNPNLDPPQEETLSPEEEPEAAAGLREAVEEKAKELAKEVAKKVVREALKRAVLALIKNPYFWLVVAIVLGVIIGGLIIYIVIYNLITLPKADIKEAGLEKEIEAFPELERAREEYLKEEKEISPGTWLFENGKTKVVVTIPCLKHNV